MATDYYASPRGDKNINFRFGPALLFCLSLLLLNCSGPDDEIAVNFAHLEYLSERIPFNGDTVAIVHIYSEYPDYYYVEARDEGITCVDDVARAAILRLRHYQLTGDPASLHWARDYLRFLLKMQTRNGQFYNFIGSNYLTNVGGKTSFSSFGWWAVRAYEALALGHKIFREKDPGFAGELRNSFLLVKMPLAKILANYPATVQMNGRAYPTYLINRYAADATSVLVNALATYLETHPDEEITDACKKLAEGILQMQYRDDLPFTGFFLSYPDIWHAWGNSQAHALSRLGDALSDTAMIAAVRREVHGFYPQLLLQDWLNEIHLPSGKRVQFPQIAYGVRTAVLGALGCSAATGSRQDAYLAGLLGSWLTGNNLPGVPMYDPATGRGYDGIIDSTSINRNAGAESTIEALRTVLEIGANPDAERFFTAKPVSAVKNGASKAMGKYAYRVYELQDGSQWVLVYSYSKRDFKIEKAAEWVRQ